jgi:ribosomal protein S28E/S33
VHLWVAVDLARRREEEPRALHLRKTECVVRPIGPYLEGLQRKAEVVDRTGRAGEVIHEVDVLRYVDMNRQIMRKEDESVAADVLDVRE